MNMSENANLILFLQAIGWKDTQITNFILCVGGSRTIKDGAKMHRELCDDSDEKKE